MEGERQDEAPALERGEQALNDQMCHGHCPCPRVCRDRDGA